MQKILSVLALAVAFVFGRKEIEANLKKEIANRDETIAGLQKALDDENADDASLEAAATEAKARQAEAETRYNDLLNSIDDAQSKADELAAAINNEAQIPITVSPEGQVTQEPLPADQPPV